MQLYILKNMYCIFVSIPRVCSVTLGETNILRACFEKVRLKPFGVLGYAKVLSLRGPFGKNAS